MGWGCSSRRPAPSPCANEYLIALYKVEEFQKESLKSVAWQLGYLTEESLGSEPLFSIMQEKGFRSKTLKSALSTTVFWTQFQGRCMRAGLGSQLSGRSNVLPTLISHTVHLPQPGAGSAMPTSLASEHSDPLQETCKGSEAPARHGLRQGLKTSPLQRCYH